MNVEVKALLQKAQRLLVWNTRKLYYNNCKNYQRKWPVKRGEVCFVDLGENIGSEENKLRPCVVLQSDAYNFSSSVFTCAIISTSALTIPDIQIPITGTYSYVDERGNKRFLSGTIDLGQIKTIAKERIIQNIGMISTEMPEVDHKLLNALGLASVMRKKDNQIRSLQGKVQYLSTLLSNR